MQLVKYKPQAAAVVLKNMLPAESEIIRRALAVKVKDIKPLDAVNELATTFTTAYTIAGQQAEPVTLALYVDEFYEKLMESYPRVSMEEVKAAIRSGVYGEYGEFYGLNPKTFIGFIRSYLASEERKAAKEKFEKPIYEDVKPTDEEVEQSNVRFTNDLYTDFLSDENFKMEYIPSFVYDVLLKKEMINLSGKTKNRLYRQADNYLKIEANEEKLAALFGKLKRHLTGEDKGNRQMIIAKQLAVWEYFEMCKLFDAEGILTEDNKN